MSNPMRTAMSGMQTTPPLTSFDFPLVSRSFRTLARRTFACFAFGRTAPFFLVLGRFALPRFAMPPSPLHVDETLVSAGGVKAQLTEPPLSAASNAPCLPTGTPRAISVSREFLPERSVGPEPGGAAKNAFSAPRRHGRTVSPRRSLLSACALRVRP